MLRHVPYTGTRIAVYSRLRQLATDDAGHVRGGVGAKLAMGAGAGAIGQLVAVPADLVKVRMQGDQRNVALGLYSQPKYRNLLQAFSVILRKEGGVVALWRGTGVHRFQL